MYADDMAFIFVGDTAPALQSKVPDELTRALAWFPINQLTLDLLKTRHTAFHSRIKNRNYYGLAIHLDIPELPHVSCYKYFVFFLFFFVDSDMLWKSQINNICLKAPFRCYNLLKARDCFDSIFYKFFTSYVYTINLPIA